VLTEDSVRSENTGGSTIREIMVATAMSSLFVALFVLVASRFRIRAALQAEILALRHQLAVCQKNAPRRLRLHRCDRLLWVVLYRFWSGWRRCLEIVRPRHRPPLAPPSFRLALDQEIPPPSRKARSCGQHSQSNSAHEPSEPVVGSTPHSRRTAQVGDCGGAIHGGDICVGSANRLPRVERRTVESQPL
jgi:hypothetical protein